MLSFCKFANIRSTEEKTINWYTLCYLSQAQYGYPHPSISLPQEAQMQLHACCFGASGGGEEEASGLQAGGKEAVCFPEAPKLPPSCPKPQSGQHGAVLAALGIQVGGGEGSASTKPCLPLGGLGAHSASGALKPQIHRRQANGSPHFFPSSSLEKQHVLCISS